MRTAIQLILILTPTVLPAGAKPSDSGGSEPARGEVRRLLDELERLQEMIIDEWDGERERELFLAAEAVMEPAEELQRLLTRGEPREKLDSAFETMDERLHRLLERLLALKGEEKEAPKRLRRLLNRIEYADEEIHFLLSRGDPSPERRKEVLRRQARMLARRAEEMHEAAQLTSAQKLGRVTLGGFRDLQEKSRALAEQLGKDPSVEEARKSFQGLTKAWELALRDLRLMLESPRRNRYLLRKAAGVERAHGRIFELLDMPGKRPRLSVGT